MRSLSRVLAAAIVCAVGALCDARADDRIDCAHAVNQNDMNVCAQQDFQKSDGRLNAVYRKLVGKLDAREKEQLKTAQKAWLAYRDAECTYTVRNNEGGSIYPLVWSGCLTTQTEMRIKQLQAHLDCADNKDSCTEE